MVNKILDKLYDKYNLEEQDIQCITEIIEDIYNHPEFIKRCQKPYMHHDQTTLGEHILEDTIMTYILSLKYQDNNSYDLSIALKIAMFHDLYTDPWQNTVYKTKFLNKHGFRHPLEAAVNALTWYPEYFEHDIETLKINNNKYT